MARTKLVTPSFLILIFSLGLSLYLTRHHYHLTYALQDSKSICNVTGSFDCDAVNTSTYSEFFGIPIALIATFVVIALMLLLFGYKVLGEDERQRPLRFYFYLTGVQLAVSLFLAAVSATVLKTFCLLCSATYVLNFLLFIMAFKMTPPPRLVQLGNDVKALFRSSANGGSMGLLFILGLIPVGSVLAHGMYMNSLGGSISQIVNDSVADWETNKQYSFDTSSSPQIGNPDAPFVLVEFFDFQCGHCRRASHSLSAFVRANKEKVNLVFQVYPLDGQCNPGVQGHGNGRSCELAKASICAHNQNKFYDAYSFIFDRQGLFDENTISDLKSKLGLDSQAFDDCMNSPTTQAEITRQAERGTNAGIRGTPTVFAQGRQLNSGFLIPVLEAALKKSQKK